MAIRCPTCSRSNPESATYCHFDGRALTEVNPGGPMRPGTLPFLGPFTFPDGQRCENFDQLALACNCRWNEARVFLLSGVWCAFFGKMGRADLAAAAVQAAKHTDHDVGLAYLLERLPTDALRLPALSLLSETEELGSFKPGEDHKFEVVISNRGGLVLTGTAMTDCDWLFFGDRQGNLSRKLFQTRDNYTLSVRVIGGKLRAGRKPLEGKIVIQTNGGAMTVVARALVPILPFPTGQYAGNVLAGAVSPREVAVRAKKHQREAAAQFEQGAVKAWYTSNGWTYPVQGTQGEGKGAVQQFFEAVGLTKAPVLEISPDRITCRGAAGQRLGREVVVSTKESKFVYADAHSNQPWVRILPRSSHGNRVTIPLLVEVPPCPGQSLQAQVVFQGNGQQRFVVPVALTVDAGPASRKRSGEEESVASGSKRSLVLAWTACVLMFFLAMGAVALLVLPRVQKPPAPDPAEAGTSGENLAEPGLRPEQVEIAGAGAWWDGIAGQKLEASSGELIKLAPGEYKKLLERLRVMDKTDRLAGYKELAKRLPKLVRDAKTPGLREALTRFLTESCVHEPRDSNILQVLRALARLYPEEGKAFNPDDDGLELDDALFAHGVVFAAMMHPKVADHRRSDLKSELATPNVFGITLNTNVQPEELKEETEKLLAERCYRNVSMIAVNSTERALAIRARLIDTLPRHLSKGFRESIDAAAARGLSAPEKVEAVRQLINIDRKKIANADSKVDKRLLSERKAQLKRLLKDRNLVTMELPLRGEYALLLMRALRKRDESIDSLVLTPLKSIDLPEMEWIKYLPKVLVEALPESRRFAAERLARLGNDALSALPELRKALIDSDVEVRYHVIAALGNLGKDAKDVADDVRGLAKWEREAIVATLAIDALRKIGGTKQLNELLRDENRPALLVAVMDALVAIDGLDRGMADLLANQGLRHKDETVRSKALACLDRLGLDTVKMETLVEFMLLERSTKVREQADKMFPKRLNHVSDVEKEYLRSLLAKTNKPNKIEIGLVAAKRLGPEAKKSVPALLDLLKVEENPRRKLELAAILAGIDTQDKEVAKHVSPILVKALDPKGYKADLSEKQIVKHLGDIGKPAVGPVFKALAEADGTGTGYADHRMALLRAVERLGPEAYSRENLIQIGLLELSDPFLEVKAAARQALRALKQSKK